MATAYEKVQLARGKGRPSGLSFIQNIFPDFIELHGDRRFADDPAVIGGIATLGGRAVTVIAIEKGADTKDKVYRNFGSPNPEGYRKALRLMKQAEKFHRPVICFVDTSGAFCGIGAEERGQGQAIAENLVEMIGLKTPVISILVGEGGSGGTALDCLLAGADSAVELSISLAGAYLLWMGLINVASEAGLIEKLAARMHKPLRLLMPDAGDASASVTLNLAANFFGLGNAATPFGLDAMKRLNAVNPDKQSASNAICMFLALNASAIELMPTGVIAVRIACGSANAYDIVLPTFISSVFSAAAAILACKFFESGAGVK